tara:strand:+ start:449 stop:601 length:153 start_codon:yes stop_codon:yes gene_type:complete
MIRARALRSFGSSKAYIIPRKGGIVARSKGLETEGWGGNSLDKYNCTTGF